VQPTILVNFSVDPLTAAVSTRLIGWFGSSAAKESRQSAAEQRAAQWSKSGPPIVGKPQLDSKRGKDVMQQVTGDPQFRYANVHTYQRHAADSQPGHAQWG
jgi:hypothetical protein